MALVGVAEAAADLAVTPRRVRQLIDSGVLDAVRVGGRWLVEESDVVGARDRAGVRPLSERSAWALVVAPLVEVSGLEDAAPGEGGSSGRPSVPAVDEAWRSWWIGLDGVERARARTRRRAVASAAAVDAAATVLALRGSMRRRARRLSLTAALVDLPGLFRDERLTISGLSLPSSGISSGGVLEAYVREGDLAGVRRDFLLRGGSRTASVSGRGGVVLHVVSDRLPGRVPAAAPLVVVADLADWRSPRETGRAVEVLLADIAEGAVT